MMDDFLTGLDEDQIKSALKLQKLVKDSSTQGNPPIIAHFLQTLISESEKL